MIFMNLATACLLGMIALSALVQAPSLERDPGVQIVDGTTGLTPGTH